MNFYDLYIANNATQEGIGGHNPSNRLYIMKMCTNRNSMIASAVHGQAHTGTFVFAIFFNIPRPLIQKESLLRLCCCL